MKTTRDVLEGFAGKSTYANHGQRVVVGYQLMQSASDISRLDGRPAGAALLHPASVHDCQAGKSNRESLISFIGEEVAAVRWRAYRIYPKEFIATTGNPSILGLGANAWVIGRT